MSLPLHIQDREYAKFTFSNDIVNVNTLGRSSLQSTDGLETVDVEEGSLHTRDNRLYAAMNAVLDEIRILNSHLELITEWEPNC